MMHLGEKLNDCSFMTTGGQEDSFADYAGRWLILYFYPKDATPGCTLESQLFRDAYPELQSLNAEVLGVSRDSIKSHEQFKCKQNLPFELISDEEEHLCQLFAVIKMKNMYGKQVRGIERSTFLIDPQGYLRHEWRQVKVPEHVGEVIACLKALQA